MDAVCRLALRASLLRQSPVDKSLCPPPGSYDHLSLSLGASHLSATFPLTMSGWPATFMIRVVTFCKISAPSIDISSLYIHLFA